MENKRRRGEGEVAFFARNILMSSTAGMIAETVTIPLDTAKVRMQLQIAHEGFTPRYNGVVSTVRRI